MHIETYNCIGEENKKKFYQKLKELEKIRDDNPGRWGPEIDVDMFRQFGELIVFDDEEYIRHYEVCPVCGRMKHISTKKFEHGKSKNRYEDITGFDIRPLHWVPRVTVIRKCK